MKHFYLLAFLLAFLLPISAQLNESFEGETFPPDGWEHNLGEGNTRGWQQLTSSTHSASAAYAGGSFVEFESYYTKSGITAELITPAMDLTSTPPTLRFYTVVTSGSRGLHVDVSADNGATWQADQLVISNSPGESSWTEHTLDLSSFATSTQVKVRFWAESSWGYGSCSIALDEVEQYQPAPMEVSSVSSTQPNTEVAAIGAASVEILQVNVAATGLLNPQSVTQFIFSTNGTSNAADITKASLYYCGISSDFSDATLFGEVNTPNGDFTITGTQQLSEGDNYFWLAYDIASSAAVNNTIDAECSSVTVASSNHTPDVTEPEGNRLLSKILNMQAGTNTYTVDGSVAFYDDGGKDNDCTEDFEGTITFVPNSPGKKIKIEWNNFAIFNTSSTGNNDEFRVYNGTTDDEANLVGEYSTVPPSITSMSADGALTIYFKVNTGIPKAGWDALVQEITPQDMAFDAVLMYQMETSNVAAGDQDQVIALIEVSTQHTENRLTAESFSLSTNGTTSDTDITKAKVYYTGANIEFATDNLFGELENPTGSYSISGSQALVEGSNFFWVVYDVSNTATEGNVLDAEVSAITTSGTAHNLETVSADGSRTINNTYFMPFNGSQTKTLYAPISFVDDGGETSNYNVSANSTVTFVPSVEGEKVKINFEAFEVLYQASEYGTKAFFAIYNGSGTATADIVWKADETNCSEGPAGIITSSADDGSLTIKFVGNGYAQSQTKAGWKAQVWSDVPSDMEFQSAEISQTTQIVKAGSTDQEMLHVVVNMSGTLNPVVTTDFGFNTQGSTDVSDIAAARLYSTGINGTFSIETQSGDEVLTPNGEFTISHTGELKEGVNHFWLVYDIASGATVDNVVDASLDKITVGTTEYPVAEGNPDGSRAIKRLYDLQAGVNEVIVNENPLAFYDDGGLSANYSKDFEGIVTFVPETEGQRVRMDITSLQITWAEDIEIYNGSEATEDNLIVELDDDNNITSAQTPLIVKSTSADGRLTFKFKSGSYSTPEAGFEAAVYTFEPQPYAYQGCAVGQGTTVALRGESDVNILQIPVDFAGETTAANVNAITFTTGGTTAVSDVASAQIYYTGTDVSFNPISAVKYGELQTAPNGTVKVNGSQDVSVEGTVYFWLMYNVSSSAVANNVLDATISAIEVNNVEHAVADGNPMGDATIQAGLSGNFTIGSGADADYANFTEAFTAIASTGVEGAVTVAVEDGTYNERVSFPHVKGASATNTITFISESENADNVTLSNSISGDDYSVLTVAGADYVTFKNITFSTTDKDYESVVMLNNQSRHVTFDACVFNAPIESESSSYNAIDVSCIKNKAENVANQNNDYLTVKNSRLIGGEIGAYIGGTGYVSLPKELGAQFLNNTFEGQFSKALYLNNENDAIVTGNSIVNSTSLYSSFNAIDAYRVRGNSTIANNTITLNRTNKSNGIQFRPITGTSEESAKVYNNIIVFEQSPGSSNGMLLDDACENTQFYFNTVVMQGDESTGSNAFYVNGSSTEVPVNIDVKNNILINNAGGKAVKVQRDEYLSGLTFDYNDVYSTGAVLASVGYGDNLVEYADLAAWQAKVTAANSISEDVAFYSATDKHVSVAGNLNAALPIDYITVDIDGETRSETTPTMGADEYSNTDFDAPEYTEGYPKVDEITYNTASLKLQLNEAGNAWWVLLEEGDAVPSVDQVVAGTDAEDVELEASRKGETVFAAAQESATTFEALEANTEYVVYVVVQDNVDNVTETVASVAFTSDFEPTEVATFEEVEVFTPELFVDGTAMFGKVIVTEGAGVKGSAKFGTIAANDKASVVLTNTDNGLTIEGFFYKSESDFVLRGTDSEGEYTGDVLVSASTDWLYADLSSLGDITSVEIESSASEVHIDNFADVPLDLEITTLEDVSIVRGESTGLSAVVNGGVLPYTYLWTSMNDINDYDEACPNVTPESTVEYTLTITDARNNTVSDKVLVNVGAGVALPATFEGLLIEPETYWQGDAEQNTSDFYSGSFKFNNYYFPDWSSWGNFGFSNQTSTAFSGLDDQFHSAVGHGANDSETYGVVYVSYSNPEIELTNTTQGEILSGCYLTNTAYAVSSMEDGDDFVGDPFTDGDWFKLIIEGYDKDGNQTGTIDFCLADFRSPNADDHYILKEWKWVDLNVLGEVQKLKLKVEGSRNNAYGLLTPGYVCIDDLNGENNDIPNDIDTQAGDHIHVYPNPTNGIVHLNLSNVDEVQRVDVFDMGGKLVKSTNVAFETLLDVDLTELNSGLYVVQIITNEGMITKKVKKQ